MGEWPPITEPELLARLALDQEQFVVFYRRLAAALGRREYQPARLERVLGYPWERPARSYLLRDDQVRLLDELKPTERRARVEAFARERHPILAFGSNAAPGVLATKFAHFPHPPDREVLVLAGDLHDFDVGACASPNLYGAMPAALFASPGTAVRAGVLWLTPAQVTQLTWSEISYHLGRLDRARFAMDESDLEVDGLFAYISRFGAFCLDGAPVALAAIPATARTAAPLTQEELLDVAAQRVIAADAHAEDLVRAVFEDMTAVLARAEATMWPSSRPLSAGCWTPYPPLADALT